MPASDQSAVDVEHRITANDNTIRGNPAVQSGRNLIGLRLGQDANDITRGGIRSQSRDDGVLVDAGDNDQWVDAGLPQHP
jgi:hypothetical protein